MSGNASSVQRQKSSLGHEGNLYHTNAAQTEALARLRYMCMHRHRFGLLLGGSGSGKSTVLQVLAHDLQKCGHVAICTSLVGRENREFLTTLSSGLGNFPDESESNASLWRSIVDRLRENRYQQRTTVILLDDADEAEMDVVTSITRLVQSDPTAPAGYTVIASAHAGRCQLLGPRLKDLCELRVELEPWDSREISSYVSQLASATVPFADEAIEQISQLTGGVPRRVTHLVELAALAGQQLGVVDAETVEAAFEELSVHGN